MMVSKKLSLKGKVNGIRETSFTTLMSIIFMQKYFSFQMASYVIATLHLYMWLSGIKRKKVV